MHIHIQITVNVLTFRFPIVIPISIIILSFENASVLESCKALSLKTKQE